MWECKTAVELAATNNMHPKRFLQPYMLCSISSRHTWVYTVNAKGFICPCTAAEVSVWIGERAGTEEDRQREQTQ